MTGRYLECPYPGLGEIARRALHSVADRGGVSHDEMEARVEHGAFELEMRSRKSFACEAREAQRMAFDNMQRGRRMQRKARRT